MATTLPGSPPKASILLRTPECRTFVCAHNDVSDVHTLTIECSTLVSQAIVGLFRSYQCFVGSETEHCVPRLTIIRRVLVEVTQHTSQPVVDTNKDHWLTIRFCLSYQTLWLIKLVRRTSEGITAWGNDQRPQKFSMTM